MIVTLTATAFSFAFFLRSLQHIIVGNTLLCGKRCSEFGIFLNDTELHLEEYSDSEWAEVEYAYQFFVNEEYDKHESMLSESEKKQVQLYKERFKKMEVNRNPVDNLLKVIGL